MKLVRLSPAARTAIKGPAGRPDGRPVCHRGQPGKSETGHEAGQVAARLRDCLPRRAELAGRGDALGQCRPLPSDFDLRQRLVSAEEAYLRAAVDLLAGADAGDGVLHPAPHGRDAARVEVEADVSPYLPQP